MTKQNKLEIEIECLSAALAAMTKRALAAEKVIELLAYKNTWRGADMTEILYNMDNDPRLLCEAIADWRAAKEA